MSGNVELQRAFLAVAEVVPDAAKGVFEEAAHKVGMEFPIPKQLRDQVNDSLVRHADAIYKGEVGGVDLANVMLASGFVSSRGVDAYNKIMRGPAERAAKLWQQTVGKFGDVTAWIATSAFGFEGKARSAVQQAPSPDNLETAYKTAERRRLATALRVELRKPQPSKDTLRVLSYKLYLLGYFKVESEVILPPKSFKEYLLDPEWKQYAAARPDLYENLGPREFDQLRNDGLLSPQNEARIINAFVEIADMENDVRSRTLDVLQAQWDSSQPKPREAVPYAAGAAEAELRTLINGSKTTSVEPNKPPKVEVEVKPSAEQNLKRQKRGASHRGRGQRQAHR